MAKQVRIVIKNLMRRNWLLYKIIDFAQTLYVLLNRTGLKVYGTGCVKLRKYVIGHGNTFKYESGCFINNLNIRIIGNNNTIYVGKNCTIQNGCSIWILGNNSMVHIGEETRIGANCAIEVQEDNQSIIIGKDNMWSHDIRIRNNDSHFIYDLTTGERNNPPKSIVVGNHVWIAAYATVLKGVNIDDGAIVATRALVTKNVDKNTIVAGVPAKVVKNNVEWSDLPK